MKNTRRRFADTLMAVATLVLLVVTLVSVNDRMHQHVTTSVHGAPGARLATAVVEARRSAAVVVEAARDRSIEHAPLTIFAVAGAVLFLFMVRT